MIARFRGLNLVKPSPLVQRVTPRVCCVPSQMLTALAYGRMAYVSTTTLTSLIALPRSQLMFFPQPQVLVHTALL